ncbi:MAG: Maf family protein [Thermodesulfobacteriota bacterium]
MKSKLVLASSSPRRKEYLKQLGIEFEIIVPDIDEKVREAENPKDYVKRIAEEKALKVASLVSPDRNVVAADTVVLLNDEILGKPLDNKDAFCMLVKLSGKTHLVLTGFSIAGGCKEILHSEVVETEVRIKELTEDEIHGYIKTEEHIDKAGAYAIQGIGAFMVESISGSYTNVVGLPICELVNALTKHKLVKIFG